MVIVRVGQSEVSDIGIVSKAIEKAKKTKKKCIINVS